MNADQPEFDFAQPASKREVKIDQLSPSVEPRFWAKVNKDGPLPDQANPHYAGLDKCWEWNGTKSERGRSIFKLEGRNHFAARVVYQMFNGPISDEVRCLHKCDNRGCVNPRHLVIGTLADNNRDRAKKGRSADRHGSRHPLAKLSEATVIEIRKSAGKNKDIAIRFGISPATVSDIRSGKRWKHV